MNFYGFLIHFVSDKLPRVYCNFDNSVGTREIFRDYDNTLEICTSFLEIISVNRLPKQNVYGIRQEKWTQLPLFLFILTIIANRYLVHETV